MFPYRRTSFYCALFYGISQIIVFFYKLKVCGSPVWSRSIGAIFPAAFAHFVSVCQILVILAVSNFFHDYHNCYGDLS